MKREKTSGALHLLMLLFSFALLSGCLPQKPPQPENPPITPSAIKSQTVSMEKPAPLQDPFDRGIVMLKEKKYSDAADSFRETLKLHPENTHARYYLMIASSQLEKPPYAKDSETAANARALLKMTPSPEMAEKARGFLLEKSKLIPSKTPKTSKPSPRKADIKTTGAVVVKTDPSFYPKAERSGKSIKTDKIKDYPAGKPRISLRKTASLEGSVLRPDERGINLAPAGIDVYLINLTGAGEYRVKTDREGNFLFKDIKPSQSYVLIALSPYRYRGFVEERYPVPMPPVTGNGGEKEDENDPGKKIEYDPKKGKEAQEEFFQRKAPRILTGDGFIYYPPTAFYDYNYPYRDYYTKRMVEQRLDYSWHARIRLTDPLSYRVFLNKSNADIRFHPEISPRYDPVGMKAYPELNDINPEIIKIEK